MRLRLGRPGLAHRGRRASLPWVWAGLGFGQWRVFFFPCGFLFSPWPLLRLGWVGERRCFGFSSASPSPTRRVALAWWWWCPLATLLCSAPPQFRLCFGFGLGFCIKIFPFPWILGLPKFLILPAPVSF
jgi:hypothetical protein